MDVGPIRSVGPAAFETPEALQSRAGLSTFLGPEPSSESLAARPPAITMMTSSTSGVVSIDDVQRFTSAVKAEAEQVAQIASSAAPAPATSAVVAKSSAGSNAGTTGQIVAAVNKSADRLYQLIMQYAGDDPKLLAQAKSLVLQAFDPFQVHQTSPELSLMTQEKVSAMIDARLAQMSKASDVNFSA